MKRGVLSGGGRRFFSIATGPAADGLGWWLAYLCQLTKTYGWSPKYVLFDLPGKQGWAFYSWAIEHDSNYAVRRTSPGYVAQEVAGLGMMPMKRRLFKKRK
jgi:hypothetical protein